MDIFGGFYSPVPILSYGRPYGFSTGARSIGKSTAHGIHHITEFLRKQRKFIYVRRTEAELAESCKEYYDEALEIYCDYYKEKHTIEYRGKPGYFIDGENAGFAIPLSRQAYFKSNPALHQVWNILYDEFMITPGGSRYLGGKNNMRAEVSAMQSLYMSVDRAPGRPARNETRVIFLGNAGTLYNPFFQEFGIDKLLRADTKYLAPKGKLWVVEQTSEVEATKDIKNSYAYQLGTERDRDYAFSNKYADVIESDFINKRPGKSWRPVCNLILDGDYYGVYIFEEEGLFFVCHRPVNEGFMNFALTTPDHAPNYYLLNRYSDHIITHELKRMYDLGCVRFFDHKCKFALDFFLGYMV